MGITTLPVVSRLFEGVDGVIENAIPANIRSAISSSALSVCYRVYFSKVLTCGYGASKDRKYILSTGRC